MHTFFLLQNRNKKNQSKWSYKPLKMILTWIHKIRRFSDNIWENHEKKYFNNVKIELSLKEIIILSFIYIFRKIEKIRHIWDKFCWPGYFSFKFSGHGSLYIVLPDSFNFFRIFYENYAILLKPFLSFH